MTYEAKLHGWVSRMASSILSLIGTSTFDFTTEGLFAKHFRSSSDGTAVDQWGWDVREMLCPLV